MKYFLIVAIALAAVAISPTAASALPCLTLSEVKAKHPGEFARYRQVEGERCWYVGDRTPSKNEFAMKAKPAKQPPAMPVYFPSFDKAESEVMSEAPAPLASPERAFDSRWDDFEQEQPQKLVLFMAGLRQMNLYHWK